jgi:hypothetical protein
MPFLLAVLGDVDEPDRVGIHALEEPRSPDRLLSTEDRPSVAKALGDVLVDNANEELRLRVALALGEFTDIDGVLAKLSTISRARNQPIDLRCMAIMAITSLERGGPVPESIAAGRVAAGPQLAAAYASYMVAEQVGTDLPPQPGKERAMSIER